MPHISTSKSLVLSTNVVKNLLWIQIQIKRCSHPQKRINLRETGPRTSVPDPRHVGTDPDPRILPLTNRSDADLYQNFK
jgi:hypothetical protein